MAKAQLQHVVMFTKNGQLVKTKIHKVIVMFDLTSLSRLHAFVPKA